MNTTNQYLSLSETRDLLRAIANELHRLNELIEKEVKEGITVEVKS